MNKYAHIICPICGNLNLNEIKNANPTYRCDKCYIEVVIHDLHKEKQHDNESYQITFDDILLKKD